MAFMWQCLFFCGYGEKALPEWSFVLGGRDVYFREYVMYYTHAIDEKFIYHDLIVVGNAH